MTTTADGKKASVLDANGYKTLEHDPPRCRTSSR